VSRHCSSESEIWFDFLFRCKVLGNQEAYDAAVEFDRNMLDKPIDLIDETIRCLDKQSGLTMEYTIVDAGTSMKNGDYFELQGVDGMTKRILAQELHEMRVD
jgi:hypothetical protein